jgi:serine protease inhibitor
MAWFLDFVYETEPDLIIFSFFFRYLIHNIMKNSILKTSLIALVAITFALISCEKSSDKNLPDKPVPINLTLKQVSLIENENSFAFDIFREIIKSTPDSKNIIISPLSISYALSMTLNGANSTTRDSMFKALRIKNISTNELNQAYKDLTSALLAVDKRVLISIANSVWTENNFVVKKPFIDILTGFYSAESKSFDITDATVPAKINTWIELKTNGLIKDMVDKLNDNTVMLLINAIYFKGKWNIQFDKTATSDRTFTRPDNSTVSAPSMHQTETHRVYRGSGYSIAELPYGQGNFVIDILLPDDNNFATVMPLLTDAGFKTMVNNLSSAKVDLYLPRFKYSYKKTLKELLSIMGMGIAFTDIADFSNISDLALLINEVTHQAFIETNEEGTEAAAATIVDIGTTSAGPEPIRIDVNRPFIYFIRETTTNSILFMGKVTDPLAN